eukprot:scaffold21515_cov46-Cylindrotheca_fusiformis.AAC.1
MRRKELIIEASKKPGTSVGLTKRHRPFDYGRFNTIGVTLLSRIKSSTVMAVTGSNISDTVRTMLAMYRFTLNARAESFKLVHNFISSHDVHAGSKKEPFPPD